MLMSAAAADITSADALSNNKAYTLKRSASTTATSGAIYRDGAAVKVGGTVASGDDALWSIHYSSAEKAYFLYNLGAGQFVSGKDNVAILSTTPADLQLIYLDNAGAWVLDCGGYFLGFDSSWDGKALFTDDYTASTAKAQGFPFSITESTSRTISADESAAIDAKIAEGRKDALAVYQDFIDKAEAMAAETGWTKYYCGLYDLTALKEALANADKYTLSEIEEIYKETLLSRLPKAGHYYRLKNFGRPTSGSKWNVVGVNTSSQPIAYKGSTAEVGKESSGMTESLCLFTVEPIGADPYQLNFRWAATGEYLASNGSSGTRLELSTKESAATIRITPKSDFSRIFTFSLPDYNDTWVTAGGDYVMTAYAYEEDYEQWYIEEVKYIFVNVDANGFASLQLPCPIEMLDYTEAYFPIDEYEGKVYLKKFGNNIVPANTPFILHCTDAEKTRLAMPVSEVAPTHNTANHMAGTNVATTASARHVFNNGTFVATKSGAVTSNSAWLVSSATGDIPTTYDESPNYATIDEILAGEVDTDAEWYDLQGRRVLKPVPGTLYINSLTHRVTRIK